MAELAAPAPSIRFEIWGEADSGGPDAAQVLATTGSFSPAANDTLTYFQAQVTGPNPALAPGERCWFVVTVVGESGAGALEVGQHTENSVYQDDGRFWYSNDPAGVLFDGQDLTPEMAFQIEIGPNLLVWDDVGCTNGYLFGAVVGRWDYWNVLTDADSFAEKLTDGTDWDLVVVSSSQTLLTAAAETGLIDYVDSGGRLAVNYDAINESPALAAALDASTAETGFTFPRTIHVWDSTAPIVLKPNALPGPLSPAASSCGQEGAVLDAAPLGRAIAGFTASPTVGETAVVVGNGGRTVLVSEVLGLFGNDGNSNLQADGLDLAENIVDRLIQTIQIDDFESGDSCAWSAPVCAR